MLDGDTSEARTGESYPEAARNQNLRLGSSSSQRSFIDLPLEVCTGVLTLLDARDIIACSEVRLLGYSSGPEIHNQGTLSRHASC